MLFECWANVEGEWTTIKPAFGQSNVADMRVHYISWHAVEYSVNAAYWPNDGSGLAHLLQR